MTVEVAVPKPPSWKSVRTRFPSWWRPFVAVEWLMEWLVWGLERWALVKLLSLLGSFSLLYAVIVYLTGADDRARTAADTRKARQYQAWQVINLAQGKGGSGGRIDALQDLARDSVDLAGVNLSHAWLARLRLPGADMENATLDSTTLVGADLRGVAFYGANLKGASLGHADLRGAELAFADLTGAELVGARLEHANLSGAILRGADLSATKLSGARLSGADLRDATITSQTVLDSASLSYADLRSARVSSPGLLGRAALRGANLAGIHWITSPDSLRVLESKGAVLIADDSAWAEYRDGRHAAYEVLVHGYEAVYARRARDRRTYLDSVFPPVNSESRGITGRPR